MKIERPPGPATAMKTATATTTTTLQLLATLQPQEREIQIAAPPGFRPSDWIDRFVDFLAENHPVSRLRVPHDLLDSRFTKTGRVLLLRAELLASTNPSEIGAARQILEFAAEHKMTATVDAKLAALGGAAHALVASECKDAGLVVVNR